MSEMHLRQHRFTYSARGPFTKNRMDTNLSFLRGGGRVGDFVTVAEE